jgi:hypothetical protein
MHLIKSDKFKDRKYKIKYIRINSTMNQNLKQYLDFIEDFEKIQTETYLVLLRNAAGKKVSVLMMRTMMKINLIYIL